MRIVLDASVAVQGCIDAGGLGRLTAHQLFVPPIFRSETISALHELRHRQAISEELSRIALERFATLSLEESAVDEFWDRAWALADQLGWAKTYDAEYVALSRHLDAPLVTLDARLARGAGRVTRIIGPAEL
jgi:predicted nucleic acid-binding protein